MEAEPFLLMKTLGLDLGFEDASGLVGWSLKDAFWRPGIMS